MFEGFRLLRFRALGLRVPVAHCFSVFLDIVTACLGRLTEWRSLLAAISTPGDYGLGGPGLRV